MATLTDTAGKRVMGSIVCVTDEVSGEEEEKERNWMKDSEKKRKIPLTNPNKKNNSII